MLNRLRSIVAAFGVGLLGICIIFWMRSFKYADHAAFCVEDRVSATAPASVVRMLYVISSSGRFSVAVGTAEAFGPKQTGFRWMPFSPPNSEMRWEREKNILGFSYLRSSAKWGEIAMPFWILIAGLGLVSIAAHPWRLRKFTLLDILAVTSFAALMLAVGVVLSQ